MTIDAVKINERLEKLKEYSHFLKKYRSCSFNEFRKNDTVRAAVERYFQLSIECVIDVSEILISNLGLRKPESSKDVLLILGEVKIFPNNFLKHFVGIAGFRNILVHEYLSIDSKKVYNHLQNDLDDFSKFTKYIGKFLSAKNKIK